MSLIFNCPVFPGITCLENLVLVHFCILCLIINIDIYDIMYIKC